MKLAIGNDHAGYDYKVIIKKMLEEQGHELIDCGSHSSESCDFPVYAKKVADCVASGEVEKGVLICGTGIGVSITANKVKGIRCALCNDLLSARLTKTHNNANIIALGARIIGIETAKALVNEWMDAEFLGGKYQRRLDMLTAIENGEDI
jgi:ribose 5-phosphate isomerase B